MRDRERIKFQKEIWAAIEKILVKPPPGDGWVYYRRGEEPLRGFTITKKGDPNEWEATDETAPKGWELKLLVGSYRPMGGGRTQVEFKIYAKAHYTKYGRAGANFYTTKRFPVLVDGSDLEERIAELRAFIQRRRRRVRHTAKQKGANDGDDD